MRFLPRAPVLGVCAALAASAAVPGLTLLPSSAAVVSAARQGGRPTTTRVASPFPAGTRALATPAGVVVPVISLTATGARVRTPCGRTASVRAGVALGNPMVVLDPGHGGDEDGVIGPNGLKEKDLNLAVAREAQGVLEADGYPVALTRTADYRVTLDVRGEIAKVLDPALFVSIHHNAVPDGPTPGPGTEMYYQRESPQSRRLAGVLYEDVYTTLRSLALAWVGDRDAGVKTRLTSAGADYYGVLRRTAAAGIPGVLAELAFLSNPPEAEALARLEVQRGEGAAIAHGIERYLTTADPGSGFVAALPRTEPAGPGGGALGCVDPTL